MKLGRVASSDWSVPCFCVCLYIVRASALSRYIDYSDESSCGLSFSYPEPFLRAVNGARQGALAKSISNWHLIGYNEGYCSNNVYILLPCFYGIRFWIWPEPLVAPRVRRALGTRMAVCIPTSYPGSYLRSPIGKTLGTRLFVYQQNFQKHSLGDILCKFQATGNSTTSRQDFFLKLTSRYPGFFPRLTSRYSIITETR